MMKTRHLTMAVVAVGALTALSAQTPRSIAKIPKRAQALVIDRATPAPKPDPRFLRNVASLPRIDNAARRKIAIAAGMPHTFSLTSTPTTLSARRMFVDGVARLESTSGHFVTNPQYDYLQVDTSRKSLDIHFNVAKANTFVLVMVRGWIAHPDVQAVPYLHVPGSEKKVEAAVGSMIPFVIECQQPGWHQVTFALEGPLVLFAEKTANFFVVRSIELSTFSS